MERGRGRGFSNHLCFLKPSKAPVNLKVLYYLSGNKIKISFRISRSPLLWRGVRGEVYYKTLPNRKNFAQQRSQNQRVKKYF